MMKKINVLLLLCFHALSYAQIKWYNPMEATFPVVQNQAFTDEIGKTYTRLPERAKTRIRSAVWELSQNSSGLSIHFYSDAPEIHVRYKVRGSMAMPHMPATGVSGVDMYRLYRDGKADFCFGTYAFRDTIVYTYPHLAKEGSEKKTWEYHLFLPLYNSVVFMEIGVPQTSRLDFIPLSTKKPIVLYGTSIAQGACASRPAMAWPTILQRSLGDPLINFGFSGNGKLEPAVLDFVGETDARLYILDCLPNLLDLPEPTLTKLIVDGVKQLRAKRSAPILLIEHIGYSNAQTNDQRDRSYKSANRASAAAYKQLQAEGIKAVYYLSHADLHFPAEGWVDHIHPSDLGMQAQASVVKAKVRAILRLPVGVPSSSKSHHAK